MLRYSAYKFVFLPFFIYDLICAFDSVEVELRLN